MNENVCPDKHRHEQDLLDQVAKIVRQAKTEYAADCSIAARLEITKATRLLDLCFRGEGV